MPSLIFILCPTLSSYRLLLRKSYFSTSTNLFPRSFFFPVWSSRLRVFLFSRLLFHRGFFWLASSPYPPASTLPPRRRLRRPGVAHPSDSETFFLLPGFYRDSLNNFSYVLFFSHLKSFFFFERPSPKPMRVPPPVLFLPLRSQRLVFSVSSKLGPDAFTLSSRAA